MLTDINESVLRELRRIKTPGGEWRIIDNEIIITPKVIPRTIVDTFIRRIKKRTTMKVKIEQK